MALEGSNRGFGLGVVKAGYIEAVAVAREHRLEGLDFRAFGAGFQARAVLDGGGRHVMADSRLGQLPPGEMFAGIDLAAVRYVRMRQHPLGPDAPARDNILAERDDGFDLSRWIGWRAAPIAGIGDFDPDRNIVHVALSGPNAAARVPGAARLRHELEEASVLPHKIVRRHFRRRITKLPQGGLSSRQAGIMQENRVWRPAALALAVVGRGIERGGQ